jgi:hypothetical protein
MGVEKKTEKSFYRPVGEWFQNTWHCENVEEGHCFDGLDLLTGDVVGTQAGTQLRFACELKDLPYPVGSQGYGAIGQALFLPADYVYVGYVASDLEIPPSRSWLKASTTRTMKHFFRRHEISVPQNPDQYFKAFARIVDHYCKDLDLGFLVVHERLDGRTTVEEIRRAPRRRQAQET